MQLSPPGPSHIQKQPPSDAPLRHNRAALSDAFHQTTLQHYFSPPFFFFCLSFKPPFSGFLPNPPSPAQQCLLGAVVRPGAIWGAPLPAVPALLSPVRRLNGSGANSAEYF